MANLTPEELEQLRSPVLPPANLPLGSGTPLAGLLDIGAMNAVNGIDPVAQLGQNLGMDQFSLGQPQAAMPEIDLTGAIEPQPYDQSQPSGIVPSPETKLAAAEVVLGQQPAEPELVDKKVGETSTSTQQQIESQASKDASAAILESQKKSQAAADKEMDAVANQAKIDGEINERNAVVDGTFNTAVAELRQEKEAEYKAVIAGIEAKQAELANYKPETFWGSKSTADKLTAALSVGLGAYGQSLLGSGSNIGQVLLERNMQEFDRNQQAVYQNKLKEIDGMKGNLDMKRKLAQDAEMTLDAYKLAGRSKIQSEYAKMAAMAKTGPVQAAIMQRQAGVDMDVAKMQSEIASKHEQRITTTTQQDILKKVQAVPGMTKDGKPLNEGQAKAASFYQQMSGALKNIEDLDESAIAGRGNLQQSISDARANESYSKVPIVGQAIMGVIERHGMLPQDKLKEIDPEGYNYLSQVQPFVNGILRSESGAAIGSEEFTKTYNQYFPVRGDGPKEIAQKKQAREKALDSMFLGTNLATRPK